MTRSLGEIEALARRAARGAGMPWALAEEAGTAVRWLEAFDLPGCKTLASYLASPIRRAPKSLAGTWSADGDLCPITAGASLGDCARRLSAAPVSLKTVTHGLLLLPFADRVSLILGKPVSVGWASTDGRCLQVIQLPSEQPDDIVVRTVGQFRATHGTDTRGRVQKDVWERLQSFAAKTYAPSTEASRRLGAGAGLTDGY